MANIQAFSQNFLTLIKEPVLLECNFVVGSTGAVGTLIGSGVSSIERLGVGVYRINLDRTYNRLFSVLGHVVAPLTGSEVAAGSLVATTLYRITTLGTTLFTAVGAKENRLGEAFVASGTTTGTGKATAIAPEQVVSFQIASSFNDTCSHIVVRLVDDGGAAVEALEGSKIHFTCLLRRSSVKGQGE
jgi:hypothetical protein